MKRWWLWVGFIGSLTAWAQAPRGPVYDAFWLAPKLDADTWLLWQLDDENLGHKENLIDQLEEDISNIGDSSTVLDREILRPDRRELIGSSRAGDAALDHGGRFGGSVRVAGKGWLKSQFVDVLQVARETGAWTLDFWVQPDAAARDAVLASFTMRGLPQPLTLERRADGQLVLQVGREQILTHSRKVLAGEWTHIALVGAWSPRVLVNGTAEGVKPEAGATLARALAGGSVSFSLGGGDVAGKGLIGRIDAVRLSQGARLFYEQDDPAWYDVAARRPLERRPPYFVFNRPLNVASGFDGSFTPAEAAPGVTAKGEAKAEMFTAGVRGQALDLRKVAAAGFSLTGTNLFPLERGSLEFWVRPVDWDNFYSSRVGPQDVKWLPLLRVGPAGQAGRVLAISQGKFSLSRVVLDAAIPFQPGKWTHVLISWSGNALAIYLDGRPQPLSQVSITGNPPAADAENVLTFLPSNTLVDELRVYPWPLTATEAGNAHARFFANAAERLVAMPFIQLSPAYDYHQQYLSVGVSCLPVDDVEPVTAEVRMFSPDGKTPLFVATNLTLNASLQSGPGLVFSNLPFGRYPMEALSKSADGKVLKTLKSEFVRETPPWWQNDLGKNHPVPKPWTPITVSGQTIQVWDRTVTLAPGGLPASLVSSNLGMFAAPPRLHGTIAGATATFAGTAAPVIKAAPARTEWSGKLQSAAVTADVQAWMEYDGLMYYTVTLQPVQATAEIQALTLDFPLAEELATQLIVNGGGHNFRASHRVQMLPNQPGQLWNSRSGGPGHKGVAFGNFCPVVWIGNDDRGICFFGENDRGWTPNSAQPAQEIIREAGQVLYRMNIINQPIHLAGPRTFTFIIHATPTKPLPPGWRGYNRGGANGANGVYDAVDAFVGPTLTVPSTQASHEGINFKMEPTDWESARINADRIRGRFGKTSPVFFYMDYSWPQMGPSMNEYRHGLFWTGRLTWSREVEDYMVWIINEYIRRGIIDGIYIDDVSMGSTRALYSTAYLMDDGQLQPGFNTMGFRRFLQRVWVLFDQQGKQPHILPHMTYCFEIPALSFSSAVVNGEDRDIFPFAQHTFLDVWSRDELRIMSSSPKWGFINFWKPGVYDKVSPAAKPRLPAWMHWQTRAMHALTVPNDMWYLWTYPTARTIAGPLIQFDLSTPDVRFIPYWKLEGVASATGQSLMLSLYAKTERALVIVSNPLHTEQEVTVTIDPVKLFGAAPESVVAWKDVDGALMPPAVIAASAAELKQVKVDELGIDDLLTDGKRVLTADAVDDFLQGDSPEEKARKHLALRPAGNTVTFRLRPRDFRLLEVSRP